jgi:hypothetical protein
LSDAVSLTIAPPTTYSPLSPLIPQIPHSLRAGAFQDQSAEDFEGDRCGRFASPSAFRARGLGARGLSGHRRISHVATEEAIGSIEYALNHLRSMFLGSVSTVYEPCSVPAKKRPAYTPMQTMVYRPEVRKALRRIKKVATSLIFEAASSREADPGR